MKIFDERFKQHETQLKYLNSGDTFIFHDEYYIKTNNTHNERISVVELENGMLMSYPSTILVTPLNNASFIIYPLTRLED